MGQNLRPRHRGHPSPARSGPGPLPSRGCQPLTPLIFPQVPWHPVHRGPQPAWNVPGLCLALQIWEGLIWLLHTLCLKKKKQNPQKISLKQSPSEH